MKFKLILAILFLLIFQCTRANYAYFFTEKVDRHAKQNEIKIIQVKADGEKVIYQMVYDWIRIDIEDPKDNLFLIRSSEVKNDREVTADFKTEEAQFFKILLKEKEIEVEKTYYKDADINARGDYSILLKQKELKERIRIHPKTNWNLAATQKYLNKKRDSIEGVYELKEASNNKPDYTLGIVKKDKDEYDLIYFSGSDEAIWSEGDIKGKLTKTGKRNVYKLEWYWDNKMLVKDKYLEFYKNGIYLWLTDWDKMYFIKNYPSF